MEQRSNDQGEYHLHLDKLFHLRVNVQSRTPGKVSIYNIRNKMCT